MSTPVTARRENTRARLRAAAAGAFAELGFEGASVEAICDRAGFSRGAFYSNYASKDELFLDLSSVVSETRLAGVRARIADAIEHGAFTVGSDPVALVQRVLEGEEDDHRTILMFSEMRLHALRDATFGSAYLAQEDALLRGVEEIVTMIQRSGVCSIRVDARSAARLMFTAWEAAMVRGAVAGLDGEALSQQGSAELGRLVPLLLDEDSVRATS